MVDKPEFELQSQLVRVGIVTKLTDEALWRELKAPPVDGFTVTSDEPWRLLPLWPDFQCSRTIGDL